MSGRRSGVITGVGALPRRLLGAWDEQPLWASVYPWIVDHPRIGGALWWAGAQSDLRRLYAATSEVGDLPPGSRVLDLPCGGGIGLRGLGRHQGLEYVAADLAPAMLARTRAAARRLGVSHQVRTVEADVGRLPFDDASFDLVLTLTGLHCFPDPRRAVAELVRVLKPGGVLTGSALLNDSGLRFEPMRLGGRLGGILGPGCTGPELLGWLAEEGVPDPTLERSGAFAYFRGVRAEG